MSSKISRSMIREYKYSIELDSVDEIRIYSRGYIDTSRYEIQV